MLRHQSAGAPVSLWLLAAGVGVGFFTLGLVAGTLGCGSASPAASAPPEVLYATDGADSGQTADLGKGPASPFAEGGKASDALGAAPHGAKSATDPGASARAAADAAAPGRKSSATWAPGAHNDGNPRIGAIGPHVWIMPKPENGGLALGNVRIGTSVRLRAPGKVDGEGCRGGWYAVEPRGYVCNGQRTTLNTTDPYFLALADVAPRADELMPYKYAHSRGAPMYGRVPKPEEWAKSELGLGPVGSYQELGAWASGHEELIDKETPIRADDEVPWYFEGGQRHVSGGNFDPRVLKWKTIPNGSMLAYGRSFEMYGRVWLVTSDLMLVPADRVQFMRRSKFHGVELGHGMSLPLGWNRSHAPVPIYRKQADGSWAPSGETLAGKTPIELATDNDFGWDLAPTDGKFLKLRSDPNLALRKNEVTFTPTRDKLPPGVHPGDKWLEARILPGTMTAYVGDRPIYATMFSPGKGGLPVKGLDHTIYATTQTGYFPLEWREKVATMSNEKGDPKVLWFSDVPNVEYLRAPLAMHVAYWHEDFGNKKSAECLNLSPTDGNWIFGFADPPVPQDWNAVRPGGGNGASTPVVVSGW